MTTDRIPEWTRKQKQLHEEGIERMLREGRPCKPQATHQSMGSGSGTRYVCVTHYRMFSTIQQTCCLGTETPQSRHWRRYGRGDKRE